MHVNVTDFDVYLLKLKNIYFLFFQDTVLISVHLNIGFHGYTGRKLYSFSADRNILVEFLQSKIS